MNTEPIEIFLARMTPETPTDVLLQVGDKLQRLSELLRELKQLHEAKMIERIERDGPIVAGDIRWYVGAKKMTRCSDVPATVEALLTATGGDLTRFSEHLSSGAVKYGAARQTLPADEYGRLFVTTEEPELKEGKPTKVLQKINTAFLR